MNREFRKNIRGRGASGNISSRYLSHSYEPTREDHDAYLEDELPSLKTEVFVDSSRTILTQNDSPDIGFRYSVNAYRGCEHGCAYCYARPTHEYLGLSPGLDFESKIFVKEEAPTLLRQALLKKSWKGDVVFMSGVTDCYQPLERTKLLTRQCLEVFAEFKNPVGIITKNALVTRDKDILQKMASWNGIQVFMSITTLDDDLCRRLEPRTSRPQARLQAIATLAEVGVPVGVMMAPCIPGLNDHEMPAILKAAAEAGAQCAAFTPLRLPSTVQNIFSDWLDVHDPLKKEKVLGAVRDLRGGRLNDSEFGSRMRGSGPRAEALSQMFSIYCRRYGLNSSDVILNSADFAIPRDQLSFDFTSSAFSPESDK